MDVFCGFEVDFDVVWYCVGFGDVEGAALFDCDDALGTVGYYVSGVVFCYCEDVVSKAVLRVFFGCCEFLVCVVFWECEVDFYPIEFAVGDEDFAVLGYFYC